MLTQHVNVNGDSLSRPGRQWLRRIGAGLLLCTAVVWCLGPARGAEAAVLQSMALYSQVQVNFQGPTSDLLNETVSGDFSRSLGVAVPSPEDGGEASASSSLSGSALNHRLSLSVGGSIGNFEAAGGSSAIARVEATAVYLISAATPFTLQMPSGIVADGPGAFGDSGFSLVDTDGNAVAAVAPGVGNTTLEFGLTPGLSGFSNAEGTYSAGTVLTGMLQPGTYTFAYDGAIFGSGSGGFSMGNLVLTVPEPSSVAILGLGGALLACRRRAGGVRG